MSTALAVVTPQYEDQQLLDTIKQTVCKGATDAQFRMFIEVCKSTGLNPFLKEIWYVPSVGVMAARDGYLRVANQHPQFDGMETRVERDDKNIPIKAVCTVWRKDRGHPIISEAFYNEYRKGGNVWQTYPSAMIAKVAEVLALKRSFAINGVVTEEEIGSNEERGSKEAQAEYLKTNGLELYVAPPKVKPESTVNPEVIRELADTLDQPPAIKTIEMRSAAKVAEADAALKETGKTKAPKAGGVSFSVLGHFKEVKGLLREVTGDDSAYYSILADAGYKKSNEISDDATARRIWKLMATEHNRLKQNAELMKTLEHASEVIGMRALTDLLGVHGCEKLEDVLSLGGDPLAAFLAELKEKVDERKGAVK